MRGPVRVVVAALVALLAAGPVARADAYHIEVVASDLTGDALFVTGVANLDPHGAGTGLLLASGAFYLLGAPIVHLAHGDGGVALASLGLRVGSLLPFGVGLLVADHQERNARTGEHASDEALTFFVGGAVTVLAIIAVQIVDPVLLTPDGDADPTMPLVMPLWRGSF
jgi:hypothetical protein